MKRFWEILFGLDRSSWTEGGRSSLDWMSLPGGDRMLLLLAVLALVGAGLAFVYRWDTRQTTSWARWFLFGTRAVLLLLAVGMLLEPVLVLSKEEKLPSHLLVLVDNSPSMELRDAWKDEVAGAQVATNLGIANGVVGLREKTRLDLARTVLSAEMLKKLSQDGKRIVHVHTFSDRLREEAPDFATQKSIPSSGQSTAIGSALRQAQLAYSGLPLTGVLLITDGRSTSGEALKRAVALARASSASNSSIGHTTRPRARAARSASGNCVINSAGTPSPVLYPANRSFRKDSTT